MLEVHPPQQRIHGIRDFFLHLFTITIGLLMALGLEACVQAMHHRHIGKRADSNIRQELEHNQDQLAVARTALASEKTNLLQALAFLKARQTNKPFDTRGISLAFTLVPMSDANWRTATATGAVDFVPYAHTQAYATAYQLQEEFRQIEALTFNDFLQLHSYLVSEPDPSQMMMTEAQAADLDVRRALAHLTAMDAIGEALGRSYQHAISGEQ